MNLHSRRATFMCLMLAMMFISAANADEPGRFAVSTGSLSNFQPIPASNADGDVLVVWTQTDPNDDDVARAMMRFFTRNNSGGYSAGPAQLLNSPGEPGLNANVAFHKDCGLFLATWSKKEPESAGILRDNDLRARVISADGKMGPIVNLINSEHDDDLPFPIPIPEKYTINKKAAFMIAFTRLGKDWPSRELSGIWTLLVDKNGKQVAAPKQVSVSDAEQNPGAGFAFALYNNRATSAIFVEKTRQFVIFTDHFHPPFTNPNTDTWFSVVTPTGAKKKLIQATELGTILPQIIPLSSKKLVAIWHKFGSSTGVCNRIFKTNLKPKKSEYSPMPGNSGLRFTRGAKLDNDSGSFQVFLDASKLYGAYMKNNGKIKGRPYVLQASSAAMMGMNITAVCGTNDLFVVTQSTAGSAIKLEGMVFDPLEDNLTKASPADLAFPSDTSERSKPDRVFTAPGVSVKPMR